MAKNPEDIKNEFDWLRGSYRGPTIEDDVAEAKKLWKIVEDNFSAAAFFDGDIKSFQGFIDELKKEAENIGEKYRQARQIEDGLVNSRRLTIDPHRKLENAMAAIREYEKRLPEFINPLTRGIEVYPPKYADGEAKAKKLVVEIVSIKQKLDAFAAALPLFAVNAKFQTVLDERDDKKRAKRGGILSFSKSSESGTCMDIHLTSSNHLS